MYTLMQVPLEVRDIRPLEPKLQVTASHLI